MHTGDFLTAFKCLTEFVQQSETLLRKYGLPEMHSCCVQNPLYIISGGDLCVNTQQVYHYYSLREN